MQPQTASNSPSFVIASIRAQKCKAIKTPTRAFKPPTKPRYISIIITKEDFAQRFYRIPLRALLFSMPINFSMNVT